MAEQSNEALTFIGSGIYADKAQQQLEAIGKEKETLDKLKVSNEKLQEEFNAIDFCLTQQKHLKRTRRSNILIPICSRKP